MGHFHPTENVVDKISSMLMFNDEIALHISRPVRWDNDHVVKLNDDLQAMTDEIVKYNAINRTYIALDYFDGSINRVAAMVIGARNLEKALLRSLLTPWNLLKDAQEKMDHTRLLVLEEEIKNLPWTDVWNKYLSEEGIKGEAEWYSEVMKYEKEVQSKRGE